MHHDEEHQVFECTHGGATAYLSYRWAGPGEVIVHHTVTPTRLRGQGIASALSQAATAWFREQGLKVQPLCWFYARYLRQHPEEQDVLHPEDRA